jgi:hypothetical protein
MRKKYQTIMLIFIFVFASFSAHAQDTKVFEKDPVLILSAHAGKEPGQFGIMPPSGGDGFPSDFVVDKNKNIWIMDYINRRVQKFDQKGQFLLEFPNDQNSAPVELLCLYIETDLQGNILIGPNREGYIVVIDNNGKLVNYFQLPEVEKADIDFSVNNENEIVFSNTKTQKNFLLDMEGTVKEEKAADEIIFGSETSPYSPYRPKITKGSKKNTYNWQIAKNTLEDQDAIDVEDEDSFLDQSELSSFGTTERTKRPLKVDKYENYFIQNPIKSDNYQEIITYNDSEGKLVAELKQTPSELNGEAFPYTSYTIDKKGNFYRLEVSYPTDTDYIDGNQYIGGSVCLKVWKWER